VRPEPATPRDPVELSPAELLAIVQNPKTAAEALEHIAEHPALSPEIVMALLRHPQTPGSAMARLAEQATGPILETVLGAMERLGRWLGALEALLRNPAVPEIRHFTIRRYLEAAKRREAEGARKKNLLLMLKELPVGQRLTLAKKGNKDVRMILIRDSNEMVALEVIGSPRITDSEVLAVAMMRDVCDKILRYIAHNRKYRQNRQIVMALLHNPKTPVGVSLGLGISSLSDRELVDLAKDRNIPGAVSRAAQQVLERRKGPTTPPAGEH
jgi:hypothetical protein